MARTAPVVIGHRGAAGYRPEHTLASYELAARMGADFIEPDLVSTRDHVLVARHENELSGTTDVAQRPDFAARRTTKVIDGLSVAGWFTEDFTLAELKTLRARERLPGLRQRNTRYDGLLEVPTFDEILALRAALSRELRRDIGIYPETKHPTYFRGVELDLEVPLVASLGRAGLNRASAPVFVQSFELTNLVELRRHQGLRVRLVFLTGATGAPYDLASSGDPRSYADLLTPAGLAGVGEVVHAIGPEKDQVIRRDAAGTLTAPTDLVENAHAAGLLVHPYTFRAENEFLPADLRVGTDRAGYGRVISEIETFLAAGIDGFFTDQADVGVFARDRCPSTG